MSLRRKIVFGALATLGVLTAAAACAALWLSHMNPSPFVKAGIEAGTPSAAASSQHRYDISYSSEIIAGNDRDNPSGKTSTSVAFDDAWFAADGHVYNHALATTAMALSAAVNSESQYYGDAKGDVPYVEEALTALGFHDIDTSSFAKTSKTLDEVESLVKDEEDTVAYAFACKTLPAASDGNESCNGGPLLATAGEGGNADASDSSLPGADEAASWTLVFVGVRGTFGAEWLSDARVVDPYWSAATGDHTGYRLAELDVALALADYLESHELDASNTKLLVCGHSRGGSVANLLARDLLDIAEESTPVVAPENLFAYTFAPSASTREASAGDARYHSIYNVENPTDLVPRVPLAAWGYRCYGTTVSFPGTDDEGFDEAFEAMQEARARNTGFISTQPYRFGEACPAQSVADAIAERVPTVDDLSSLSGAAQATSVLVQQDLYRILASHFPDTYLAWMQSLDPKDLTFEQAERQGGPETRSDD